MLIKLKCRECGEYTYADEAEVDPSGDLLFTMPPCPKCLKSQIEDLVEGIRNYMSKPWPTALKFLIDRLQSKGFIE